MTLQLARIEDALPEGFEALRVEAAAAGHANLGRLAAEWSQGPGLFHALIGAFEDGDLVAIGGITDEPEATSEPAWRMRRLYVGQTARSKGVGRAIASALLQEAIGQVQLVTVHAGNPGAERFWEALGLSAVAARAWSHQISV